MLPTMHPVHLSVLFTLLFVSLSASCDLSLLPPAVLQTIPGKRVETRAIATDLALNFQGVEVVDHNGVPEHVVPFQAPPCECSENE